MACGTAWMCIAAFRRLSGHGKRGRTMIDAPSGVRVPPFTYTLRQVCQRDEIVFKSVVRVLQGKTRHVWQHTDGANADLLVLGTQAAGSQAGPAELAAQVVIHVSASAGPDSPELHLPVRVADLISHLDHAGDELAGRATQCTVARAVQIQPTEPVHEPLGERVSLARWPEPALLQGDIRYLKLAAALTGQPVSIIELAARTEFPLLLCQTFVDGMKAVGLLRVRDGMAPAHTQAAPPAPRAHNPPPPAAPGLIARIRSRLEMLVGTPAAK